MVGGYKGETETSLMIKNDIGEILYWGNTIFIKILKIKLILLSALLE